MHCARTEWKFAVISAALFCNPAVAADDYCAQIRQFEAVPLEMNSDGTPRIRSIELHWIGGWLDLENSWYLECRPSDSDAARTLCDWLPDHTPFEFSDYAPMDILGCYGFSYPDPWPTWEEWKASIKLPASNLEDRYVSLQIDMRVRAQPHEAIRLSIVPFEGNYYNNQVPPLVDDIANPPLQTNF
jgi:hypothetical protein